MKSTVWTIIASDGERTIYSANFGPVTREHALTSPAVKAWANGRGIKALRGNRMPPAKNKAAQAMARLSHSRPPSPARKAAARANGNKGGRPRKHVADAKKAVTRSLADRAANRQPKAKP